MGDFSKSGDVFERINWLKMILNHYCFKTKIFWCDFLPLSASLFHVPATLVTRGEIDRSTYVLHVPHTNSTSCPQKRKKLHPNTTLPANFFIRWCVRSRIFYRWYEITIVLSLIPSWKNNDKLICTTFLLHSCALRLHIRWVSTLWEDPCLRDRGKRTWHKWHVGFSQTIYTGDVFLNVTANLT